MRGGVVGTQIGLDLLDNGQPLGGPGDLFELTEPGPGPGGILVGPRIGITRAVDAPLRFWLADEPTVSARRRGEPWRG